MKASALTSPTAWCIHVHRLHQSPANDKLHAATVKASGLPLIATVALLALAKETQGGAASLSKVGGHPISPSTMGGLCVRGLARAVRGGKPRTWVVTDDGRTFARLAEKRVTELIKRLTTPKSK